MNSQLHQYPAALYSAVAETGYRNERFTGEILRSGKTKTRGTHRRGIFRRIRHALAGTPTGHNGRPAVIQPLPHGR